MGCWKRPEDVVSTLPFSTNCKCVQRWYAAFKCRWSRWSISPASPQGSHPDLHPLAIRAHVAMVAQKFPHTLNPALCRTQKPTKMSDLINGLGVVVDALETHGGMGRIYALRDSTKVLKVADVHRSWCKYEARNYGILERNCLPCARMIAHAMRPLDGTEYTVTVLERLEFTATAFLRSAGRFREPPAVIAELFEAMLRRLRKSNLVYGDLSPDNIMFRHLGNDRYELALVDPQFLVPLAAFERGMTTSKAVAFDRIYLALKIQNIGVRDPAVRGFTDAICEALLGYLPPSAASQKWIQIEAPVGLFVAYDIQGRASQLENLP